MLYYKRIEKDNREIFDVITKWDNDKEIMHQLRPCFKEEELELADAQEAYERFVKNKTKILFVVYDEQTPIGTVSVDFAFPLFAGDKEFSAWLGICIGEKNYRGKGLGKEIITFVEGFCAENGIKRMELGVFSFNEPAKRLYERMGYKEFEINENLIYYNGSWYDDIRMEKSLIREAETCV